MAAPAAPLATHASERILDPGHWSCSGDAAAHPCAPGIQVSGMCIKNMCSCCGGVCWGGTMQQQRSGHCLPSSCKGSCNENGGGCVYGAAMLGLVGRGGEGEIKHATVGTPCKPDKQEEEPCCSHFGQGLGRRGWVCDCVCVIVCACDECGGVWGGEGWCGAVVPAATHVYCDTAPVIASHHEPST